MKNELSFLDLITIISFCVSLQNLELNITQDDLQNIAADIDKKQSKDIADIHEHLAVQDKKLDYILRIFKENGGVVLL